MASTITTAKPPTVSFENVLIDKQFLVGPQIGKGSFGVVHQAKDQLNGQTVAIKFESKSSPHAQLANEYRVNLSFDAHFT